MHVSGIISAIFVGLIIGALGRLIVPGRQAIGIIATLLIGLAAAFLGAWIGYEANFAWVVTFIVQIVLAAVGVGLVGGGFRGARRTRR